MSDFVLRPIGVVRSPIGDARRLPREGVAATIEVFPEFAAGLAGIEANSHLIVIGWMHHADRDLLATDRESWVGGRLRLGVFAGHSPSRPNPLGMTTVRLLGVDGNRLRVEPLDMVDGTPIVDIKTAGPGAGPFAARTRRGLAAERRREPYGDYRMLLREVEHFHGERCVGAAVGVRIFHHAIAAFDVGARDPALTVAVVPDAGCVADALQALSGATFGNGRLTVGADFVLRCRGRGLRFALVAAPPPTVEDALRADADALYRVEEA